MDEKRCMQVLGQVDEEVGTTSALAVRLAMDEDAARALLTAMQADGLIELYPWQDLLGGRLQAIALEVDPDEQVWGLTVAGEEMLVELTDALDQRQEDMDDWMAERLTGLH